jgi:hypothetical protein
MTHTCNIWDKLDSAMIIKAVKCFYDIFTTKYFVVLLYGGVIVLHMLTFGLCFHW